jgi:DNA-binding GntR family transcriptional regulator
MMIMLEPSPILRKPMKEEVFDVLHERIITGNYAPGEWLRQDDISSQLGISMTPVREALDLLVSAGLAERIPYRGVRVLKPTSEEIVESYSMRLLLECSAIYIAASSISPEQISNLKKILDQTKFLVELKDMSRERVLSRELHGAIVSASGNRLLYKMYLNVLNTFPDWMLYEYLFRHPELLDKSISTEYQEHRGIVDALAENRPDLAVSRTIEHITNRGRELESYLNIPKDLVRSAENRILSILNQGKNP